MFFSLRFFHLDHTVPAVPTPVEEGGSSIPMRLDTQQFCKTTKRAFKEENKKPPTFTVFVNSCRLLQMLRCFTSS